MKMKRKYTKKQPEISTTATTENAWIQAKPTTWQRKLMAAEREGYDKGELDTRRLLERQLADKGVNEAKMILDSKIRVLDAVGQCMQQMSSAMEGAWHIIQEIDNAKR